MVCLGKDPGFVVQKEFQNKEKGIRIIFIFLATYLRIEQLDRTNKYYEIWRI